MSESLSHSGRTAVAAPKILVMGAGSSGTRAVAAMQSLNQQVQTVVVDTDAKVLQAVDAERAIHVGASVTRGLSAGGDVKLGRQSISA